MSITWVAPWKCEPLLSWLYHEWWIAKPIAHRVYDLERGFRLFGIELVLHDTRTGSVL